MCLPSGKHKPWWWLLGTSSLHALWNSTVILGYHVLAIVGILSYAFLGAAILKARSLSPTRAEILPLAYEGNDA